MVYDMQGENPTALEVYFDNCGYFDCNFVLR